MMSGGTQDVRLSYDVRWRMWATFTLCLCLIIGVAGLWSLFPGDLPDERKMSIVVLSILLLVLSILLIWVPWFRHLSDDGVRRSWNDPRFTRWFLTATVVYVGAMVALVYALWIGGEDAVLLGTVVMLVLLGFYYRMVLWILPPVDERRRGG